MWIGLDLLGRIQHGDGAMADKIVQPGDGPFDDSLRFVPRRPFGQHRLGDPAEHQRPPKLRVGKVKQQIGMMLAICLGNGQKR